MPHFEVQLFALGQDGGAGGAKPALTLTDFPCVVGRHAECDRRLKDPMISRRHCAFSVRDAGVWVEDLGSRNGTRLNGQPVDGACLLGDGDELELSHLAFRVRLLGAPAEAAGHEGAGDEAEGAAAGREVLVVEDDADDAETLAVLLESWGCAVRVARDGAEALEAARARPPDTVFLDIGLPGMSGVEVARRLRSEAGLGEARLVAVTGDAGAAEVLRSRGRFAQLLVKPVTAPALRDALGQPG
jgi:CheY-like chemotaxis protein